MLRRQVYTSGVDPKVLPKGFPPYLGSSPEKGRHGVAEKNPECSNSSLSGARWHTTCLIAAFSEHNSSIQVCYVTLQCEVVSSGPKVSSQDSCIGIQWLRENVECMCKRTYSYPMVAGQHPCSIVNFEMAANTRMPRVQM